MPAPHARTVDNFHEVNFSDDHKTFKSSMNTAFVAQLTANFPNPTFIIEESLTFRKPALILGAGPGGDQLDPSDGGSNRIARMLPPYASAELVKAWMTKHAIDVIGLPGFDWDASPQAIPKQYYNQWVIQACKQGGASHAMALEIGQRLAVVAKGITLEGLSTALSHIKEGIVIITGSFDAPLHQHMLSHSQNLLLLLPTPTPIANGLTTVCCQDCSSGLHCETMAAIAVIRFGICSHRRSV